MTKRKAVGLATALAVPMMSIPAQAQTIEQAYRFLDQTVLGAWFAYRATPGDWESTGAIPTHSQSADCQTSLETGDIRYVVDWRKFRSASIVKNEKNHPSYVEAILPVKNSTGYSGIGILFDTHSPQMDDRLLKALNFIGRTCSPPAGEGSF